MARGTDTGAARGHRLPLRALLTGQGISLFGNTLAALAVPWFVLETTGSAARTGLVAFAGVLPTVVGGVLGGVVVDRLGPKRTSVVADLASGATIAVIPLLHATVGIAFWQLLVLVFLGALLDTPGNTARRTIMPQLAEQAGSPLERANAAIQTIGSIADLAGPPLAGVLIAVMGPSNVLWFDAASFAVSAVLVAAAVPSRRPALAVAAAGTADGFLAEVSAGLRFVLGDRLLRGTVAGIMVINFLLTPLVAVILPVFADREYGEATDLGLLLGGIGVGTLAGSLAYGAIGQGWARRRTLVVAFLLAGLPVWGLANAPPLAVAVALIAALGALIAPVNPIVFSAIQRRTPEALLGRVIGAVLAIGSLLAPIGMLTAGITLEAVGVRTTLVAAGAVLVVVGGAMALNSALVDLDGVNP